MAQRKKPETGPILDSSSEHDKRGNVIALPAYQFDSIIRGVKNAGIDRVKAIRTATHATLKRIGARRKLGAAVDGVPSGSDHLDTGTVFKWLSKVDKSNRRAVRQVVAIDATCTKRIKG